MIHNPAPEDVAEWRELNSRWFEFATFVPLLRIHGERPLREVRFRCDGTMPVTR